MGLGTPSTLSGTRHPARAQTPCWQPTCHTRSQTPPAPRRQQQTALHCASSAQDKRQSEGLRESLRDRAKERCAKREMMQSNRLALFSPCFPPLFSNKAVPVDLPYYFFVFFLLWERATKKEREGIITTPTHLPIAPIWLFCFFVSQQLVSECACVCLCVLVCV